MSLLDLRPQRLLANREQGFMSNEDIKFINGGTEELEYEQLYSHIVQLGFLITGLCTGIFIVEGRAQKFCYLNPTRNEITFYDATITSVILIIITHFNSLNNVG
jgi:hypothetical protein